MSEICVIGRTSFETGIGAGAYAACELFSRAFDTCVAPTGHHHPSSQTVMLPNGRNVPFHVNGDPCKIFFFTDVLWNGWSDYNYLRVPTHGFRVAQINFDSDRLPPRWVEILNSRFDVVVGTSPHLEQVCKTSGVSIPIGTLPFALDLDKYLTSPPPIATKTGKTKFVSIAAFHPRKRHDLAILSFNRAFGNREDVELLLHSNLSFGSTINELRALIEKIDARNIRIQETNLDFGKKHELICSADVLVNFSQGEAYSIAPREALAAGRPVVLSGVGGHLDLAGPPGVFICEARHARPARYPEIDNCLFGTQFAIDVDDGAETLREAFEFCRSEHCALTSYNRRAVAEQFSLNRLELSYREFIDPFARQFRKVARRSSIVNVPTDVKTFVSSQAGQRLENMVFNGKKTILGHDGGFYSVFNAFFSNLVWEQRLSRTSLVLPDWDIARIKSRRNIEKLQSFCYGRPSDGNIWLSVFEPLYGLSRDDLNDEGFLWARTEGIADHHNTQREPTLTYVEAYRLYRDARFQAVRVQYNRVFSEHIKLVPDLQNEVDTFAAEHFDRPYIFGAHVRHPSHIVEQPGGQIAASQKYFSGVREQIRNIGLLHSDWRVFLATDQQRVVDQFKGEFGDQLIFLDDVRRTTENEDEKYDSLPSTGKKVDGYQLQHLVAANPDEVSTRMAWEVVRDASLMSRCNSLLHVVSNVSTAVSYMNPKVELIYCDPT